MTRRESKFPATERQTDTGRGDYGSHGRRRQGAFFPVLFILLLAGGLYLYQMPGRPLEPYLEMVRQVLSDRDAVTPGPEAGMQERTRQLADVRGDMASPPAPPPGRKAKASPMVVDVSIGLGFRSAGFRIGAVSRSITLSDQPGARMHRLPGFDAPRQRYGVIRLASGREHGFALDLAAAGYRMFLDRNRNGDLQDDGEPLLNQGKGLFASRINLPLSEVTGIPKLKGDYRLWLFTNPGSWSKGRMRFYSMTQLRGELLLNGRRYTAYLADNKPVDGDYRNDGISIDLDGDGKIDRRSEWFPPGRPAMIDGEAYSFRITR
jgi:hypothetical protein